ncbi:SAF domain-containing protein [Nocardioides donggukensis]|uniref:Pilus assembly protein CpaB n=1 Tax=Nocardioides donggukensis TaxID=2774019 RepID=A0A927K820_9ACTN|nr:SAF domain-containing protein [Nocardioides donggukensis]MBD8870698.1 pilus assembly protein CpaB [Nocardioides donggukensis]
MSHADPHPDRGPGPYPDPDPYPGPDPGTSGPGWPGAPGRSATVSARLDRARTTVRRAVLRRRRLLAALCLAGAVLTGLRTVAPAPPETVRVLTAARDLPAGTVLAPEHLAESGFAEGTAPEGGTSRAEAVGRTLAAPLRRGEPLTDVRLVGPGLLEGYPGLVAAPVPVPDGAAVSLLRVGDRVDLLAADPRGGETLTLAAAAPVVALPPPVESLGAAGGRLAVLAVPRGTAAEIAAAAVQRYLSVTISR